ncbi:YfbU family protein [Dysgonomonas reticulitermitis]
MEDSINLSKQERLSYILQLKILQKLSDPSESSHYENQITALERGFALHYQDIFEILSEEELSPEDCQEVLDILEMYRGIIYSYEGLKREGIEITLKDDDVKFPGFDGNHEYKQMAYVKYFIDDLDRFSEIQNLSNGYYNSHSGMLRKYKAMLIKWNEYNSLPNRYLMNEEQIRKLLSIR